MTSAGLGWCSEDHPWLWCSPHIQHRSRGLEWLFLSTTVVLGHTVQVFCQGPSLPSLDCHKGFSAQIYQRLSLPSDKQGTHPLLLARAVMPQDHLGPSRRALFQLFDSAEPGQGPV